MLNKTDVAMTAVITYRLPLRFFIDKIAYNASVDIYTGIKKE